MKQKNVLLLAASLLLWTACEKNLYAEAEYAIDSKYTMQESYEVPLQSGKVTVVTMGTDTLAVTDMALTIQIPVGANITSRADDGDVQVAYVEYAALPEFKEGTFVATGVGTYLFEDSRQADYDYNDAILHVKHSVKGSSDGKRYFEIKVRGVALGSIKTIGFGFTDLNGVDYDLLSNIRRDLFGGRSGFINTEAGQPFVAGIVSDGSDDEYVNASPFPYSIVHKRVEKTTTEEDRRMLTGYLLFDPILTTSPSVGGVENSQNLKFYIKSEGEKLYVGEYNKNLNGALPYGIRVVETQNYYPLEKVNIHLAFPKFMEWIKTGVDNKWNSEANTSTANCYGRLESSAMWRF